VIQLHHLHGDCRATRTAGRSFPSASWSGLFEPHLAGLFKLGQTQLYVSRGSGYWGPPMRLGAPAEITLIELIPA
jgi:predicted MPP superfamily phosphohydrolase